MKAARLFVRCLENEGIQTIFGIPGEENLDIMDALLESPIRFVTTRHEQGAAFMADVTGRLTGKAGVCLSTLGPGATNLITGVADANLDGAPVVAVAGQAGTDRLHKESHQVLDLVTLFRPVSKYSVQINRPENIPEIVRKAFKTAQIEKPGSSFISFPEDVAAMEISGKDPLKVQAPLPPVPPAEKMDEAARIISQAEYPLVLAGNGVVRSRASDRLVAFAEKLGLPVATTFMAKGVIPFSHDLCLGAVGLHAHDYVSCGFDRADVIVCVGYDMVEYPPHFWNREKKVQIVHVDTRPADVDEHYIVRTGVVGDIGSGLDGIASRSKTRGAFGSGALRRTIVEEMDAHSTGDGFPVKPQKIVWDLRQVLNPDDVVVCDVGAHKMWMARMYRAERPNTCIISNGFAAMGIAVPGAIAAKMVSPERTVVAVTGDAGFLMNCQEIETAVRMNVPIVILIWNDGGYGLIQWKQMAHFKRESNVAFTNPDFVRFAESFGAKGYRVEKTADLQPILRRAIRDNTVAVVDCPVDYRENLKLTERLGELVCPI